MRLNNYGNSVKLKSLIWAFVVIVLLANKANCQSFFTPSDTLNKKRFVSVLAITATTATTFSIGLYNTWYTKYPTESFHLFNDFGEWGHMDKVGHSYTSYLQSYLSYRGAKWTGLAEKKAITTGIICGTLFQTTLEVFDGFSSEWGFSLSDMGANLVGVAAFASQQSYWGEQRITLKESFMQVRHPSSPILSDNGLATSSLKQRADDLFGSSFLERYLKDYNSQAYWASVNVHSFLHDGNKWPQWLNIALGYGSENLYGGYENTWEENGNTFTLDKNVYPRYHQFYIGLDIDLPKLKPRNPFLKSVVSIINIFKIPSPAIEINTQGEIKLHLLR